MIVDTSALIAVLYEEDHAPELRRALLSEAAAIPAPAALEFVRVADRQSSELGAIARDLVTELTAGGMAIVPFEQHHLPIAAAANARHGKGMGQGGKLNLLDLMVYAVAIERAQPVLCTGRDFAASDVTIHPASRAW